MKPTLEVLRDYERALERFEVVRSRVEYENQDVAVRALQAWATARNSREQAGQPRVAEIPVSAPEPSAYAAVLEHRQTGGQG